MNTYMLPLAIGAPQIILIVVVVLLLFGGKKIPELMKGLGGGIKEFKKASQEDTKENEKIDDTKQINLEHALCENHEARLSSSISSFPVSSTSI